MSGVKTSVELVLDIAYSKKAFLRFGCRSVKDVTSGFIVTVFEGVRELFAGSVKRGHINRNLQINDFETYVLLTNENEIPASLREIPKKQF